jgi:formate-dependent nitrite reductase membrane component NrfD
MLTKIAKTLAVLTIVSSIPLLLSFNRKHQWFPRMSNAFYSSAMSFSLTALPIFVLFSLIVTICILASRNISKKTALRWNLTGILVAVISVIILAVAVHSRF